MLEGADSGQLFEGKPHLPYAQVVPLDKAMDGSSLVAFKFNDQLLPKRHGFPARGLFPGWYGMDSVKWLQRIVALSAQDQPSTFLQSGMNSVYNRATEIHKDLQVARVSTVQVKSCVAWPTGRLTLPAGQHVIWGFAWSGAGLIRNVKVTKDGGKTWNPAKLERQTEAYSWVRWSYSWNASPGQYTLMSRAFDERGNQQPLERDPARKDAYELNWCVPIHCTIK
jgi:DMSO/TMAO reductase YedYZ molybdopterin-dependent catalytic subunit